jgi:ketosteroid isomerase-like protein
MTEAETWLERYLQAQADKDLDALVSCWDPAVEIEHPMRPDRNWGGPLDGYRRTWKMIWELTPDSRFEVVSTACVGNRVYLEALTEMSDGTMVPHMNVFEIEDGRIRRGRVYTDKPRRDGVDIEGYAHEVNPVSEAG